MRLERICIMMLLAVSLCAVASAQEEEEPPPIRKKPLGGLSGEIEGGSSVRQPVGAPSANLKIVLLPQAEQTTVGEAFRFDAKIVGDPFRTANDVRVVLSARTAPGRSDVRFDRVTLGDQPCPAGENANRAERTCTTAMIAPGAEAQISVALRISPGAVAGPLTLAARAFIGEAEAAAEESVVQIVTKGTLSNVGLEIQIDPDVKVAAPRENFYHTIRIRNGSAQETATDLVIEVQHRVGIRDGASFSEIAQQDYKRFFPEKFACKHDAGTIRCALAELPAKQEIAIPVNLQVMRELAPRQWGRVETQARVRCAQSDPQPGNNHAKASTDILSRVPELAFVSREVDAKGKASYRSQRSVNYGQVFGVGARFLDTAVKPEEDELEVMMTINDGPPTPVKVRWLGSDRVYRSSPMILLRPGEQKPEGEPGSPIRVEPGSTLKLTYQGSEITAGAGN